MSERQLRLPQRPCAPTREDSRRARRGGYCEPTADRRCPFRRGGGGAGRNLRRQVRVAPDKPGAGIINKGKEDQNLFFLLKIASRTKSVKFMFLS